MGCINQMTSFSGSCRQKGCPKHEGIVYADHKAWFSHYWRKGRETLIELVKKEGISKNPYGEPTWILAEKLVKISKINSEDVEK